MDEFSHLRYTEDARALLSYVCVKNKKIEISCIFLLLFCICPYKSKEFYLNISYHKK